MECCGRQTDPGPAGIACAVLITKAVGCLPVPMLAELAALDRKSAGRVLVATIAANVDDIGSTTRTPWLDSEACFTPAVSDRGGVIFLPGSRRLKQGVTRHVPQSGFQTL